MQMVVVTAVLPSLILMSRTRAYPAFRVGGAILAGVASLAWMVERLMNVQTPVDAILNVFAQHGVWLAAVLFALSLVCRFSGGSTLPTSEVGRMTA